MFFLGALGKGRDREVCAASGTPLTTWTAQGTAAGWAQPPFSGRDSLGVRKQDQVHKCPSLPAAGREFHTV